MDRPGAKLPDVSHEAFFGAHGFLGPLALLTAEELAACLALLSRLEAQHGPHAIGGLGDPHLGFEILWRLVTNPRLLDLVQAALGSADLVVTGSTFMVKYPDPSSTTGVGALPWHQDLADWQLEPPAVLGAWVALDDCSIENGCLRVIPCSHELGLLPQGRQNGAYRPIPGQLFDEARAIDLQHRAGSVSLHHGLTIHSSHGNRSSRRRAGFAIRFARPEVRARPGARAHNSSRPVVVRGSGAASPVPLTAPPAFRDGEADRW